VPDVGPSGHNSSASSSLTPEEQRRVRLKAELQAAEEWRRCKRSNETKGRQMWELVQEEDLRLGDFYDDVLFGHIE
jgi:hypothetical protein